MLKFVIASVSLALGVVSSNAQPNSPPAPGCVDVQCRNSNGQEQSGQEANSARPVTSPACSECPVPKGFDSQEVVKNVRTVDHSTVINTITVIPGGRRGKAIRHLIIHLTEVRHVGVIQHNHIIVEKTIRVVRPSRHFKRYRRAPNKPTWRSSFGSAESVAREHFGQGSGCIDVYIPNGWKWSKTTSC
jgi:hypothetical protein